MDNQPSPSPASGQPDSPKPGGNARLIAVVALAAAVAAGTMMLLRPGKAPEGPKAPEKAASAPAPVAPAPAPVPPAPKLYSEVIGDFEIPTAIGPMSLKGLKTVDSTLPKAAIEAILKGDASQLAQLDAREITADSVNWSHTFGNDASNTSYEGLKASAIKAGVIGSFTAQRGVTKGISGDKAVKSDTTIEEALITKFDLPLMMRFIKEADPEGKAPLLPLYETYRIKSTKMEFDKVRADIGAANFTSTHVRPARRPLSIILAEFNKMSEQAKADAPKADTPKEGTAPKAEAPKDGAAAPAPKKAAQPDENVTMMAIIDLMNSFELGEGTVDGMKIASVNAKPEDTFSGEIRKMSLAGGAKARFGLEGISLTVPDGSFALGKIEMGGDTMSLIMLGADKALRERATKPKPGDEELRALIKAKVSSRPIPDVSFMMEAMNGDFPAEKGKPAAGRIAFDMKRAAFLVGNFVALTPTKLDYVVDALNVPMPKESKDASIMALRAMGIERLGLSARLAAVWAEVGEKLTFQEISMDVAQLARLAITGEMRQVPRAFFEDPQRNWPSAMGATINSLVIDIENKGGLAKLVDVVAKEQKKSGEQLRNEFANIAPLVITGMLAGHPDSGKISQAVSNFIRNLNGLNMKVTAAGPNGIVLTDLALAGQNPAEFAQKLRFEIEGK